MVRKVFVWLHRWVGLIFALPLIIVALTGSLLAFHDEIDEWLNPDLLTVAKRDAPLLDGFALRDKAAALYPKARFDEIPLQIDPQHTVRFTMVPDTNHFMESEYDFYLDPYTGKLVGGRSHWSEPSLSRRNIISYLYRVHFDLALPWSTGELGDTILGVTAIAWTLDCFVSFYLTLPRFRRSQDAVLPGRRSWIRRWMPAWMIRLRASTFRINFDFHRALGLWTWAMLFVLAWSSVGFNYSQVFTPVMHGLLPYAVQPAGVPGRPKPLEHPRLGWRAAYATGHALLVQQAHLQRFTVDREKFFSFDRDTGAYTLIAKSANEGEKTFRTSVTFDADTGALLQSSWPGSQPQKAGDVITTWLFWLHTGAVLGLPLRIFLFLMGLVITGLSGTGVYIWWRKRQARVRRRIAAAVTA